MINYEKLIMESLPGKTPKQKYESLVNRENEFDDALMLLYHTPELRDQLRIKWNLGKPDFKRPG